MLCSCGNQGSVRVRKFELMRDKRAALGVTLVVVTHVEAPPQQMVTTSWGFDMD